MCGTAILRGVGALHGTCSRLVLAGAVNVVLGLDDMFAFAETVEVIVRRIVAR